MAPHISMVTGCARKADVAGVKLNEKFASRRTPHKPAGFRHFQRNNTALAIKGRTRISKYRFAGLIFVGE